MTDLQQSLANWTDVLAEMQARTEAAQAAWDAVEIAAESLEAWLESQDRDWDVTQEGE